MGRSFDPAVFLLRILVAQVGRRPDDLSNPNDDSRKKSGWKKSDSKKHTFLQNCILMINYEHIRHVYMTIIKVDPFFQSNSFSRAEMVDGNGLYRAAWLLHDPSPASTRGLHRKAQLPKELGNTTLELYRKVSKYIEKYQHLSYSYCSVFFETMS